MRDSVECAIGRLCEALGAAPETITLPAKQFWSLVGETNEIRRYPPQHRANLPVSMCLYTDFGPIQVIRGKGEEWEAMKEAWCDD